MGDASDIATALWVADHRMGLSWGRLLTALIRPFGLAALMAAAVAWTGPHLLQWLPPAAALVASVGFGIVVYGALMVVFVRGPTRRLLRAGKAERPHIVA